MLNKQLKKLRHQKKLTQQQVADCLHVSTSTYGLWEQGRNEPDVETLKQLADFFDVTIDYLVGRETIAPTQQKIIQETAETLKKLSENLEILFPEE